MSEAQKNRVTPAVGQTYRAWGQKDSSFKILKIVDEEKSEYLIKNMNTGWEVFAFDVATFSDGSMEWERSEKGRFC